MTAARKPLQALLETFAGNRALTFHMLDELSDKDLHRKWPRPGLDTFAKHFSEMAAVERAFADALSAGVMDFSGVPDVFEFKDVADRPALRQELESADRHLCKSVMAVSLDQVIDWGDGTRLSVSQHLCNVISHEVFHQGQMALAVYALGLKMPHSWVQNWALPATNGEQS